MPTYKSNLVTLAETNQSTTPGEDIGGILLLARGKVAFTSTPVAGDILPLIPANALPVGAIIEPSMSWFYPETTAGTSITFDVGTDSDDDLIADNVVVSGTGMTSGPVFLTKCTSLPAGVSTPKTITKQEAVTAKVIAVSSPVACTIQFCIAYRAKA